MGIVVLMAAAAVLLLAWIAYNRRWIHERQAMLTEPGVHQVRSGFKYAVDTPWSLRLFGEPSIEALSIPQSDCERARKLFPESMLQVRSGE
ncbi:MAG: hypothetical protein HYX69_01120 [Planctomycetia bacterium]|nr:hypothetical protein [Planctomycetia bacterium]